MDFLSGYVWGRAAPMGEPLGQLVAAAFAAEAAYVAAGFDSVAMNVLTELWVGWPLGQYSGARAWPGDAPGDRGSDGRAGTTQVMGTQRPARRSTTGAKASAPTPAMM